MILTAHQPAYLPWLGFFHKLAISDAFVILDEVQFQKNYFTNRNKIKTPSGAIWLTIPVITAKHFEKTISNMKIVKDTKWLKKHWKSIEFNYKKAPYFNKYRDYFEDLYKKEWISLIDLLNETMMFFIKEIGIKTNIYHQSKLGFKNKKQELILEICNYFNSDLFVFGRDGKNYADINYFKENRRHIYFQNYIHPVYPQLYGDFISNLSILDLLFNVGSENALDVILKGNISKRELCKTFKISS